MLKVTKSVDFRDFDGDFNRDFLSTFVFIPFTFYVFVQYIYGNSILV